MFGFIKNYFFTAMIFGCNVWNVIPLKYVSMSNQECKVRPEIINVNSNESSLYPYRVLENKWSSSCNNNNNS